MDSVVPRLRVALRPAAPEDALAVAAVQRAAWRESYATLLPESAFAAFDAARHDAQWRDYLQQLAERPKEAVFVAALGEAREIVGFASCGPQRSQKLKEVGYAGEIWALYLLQKIQRQGAGRALMRVMAQFFAREGLNGVSVWAFRDNPPARRFYEALGGQETGVESHYDFLGAHLPDVAYGWRAFGDGCP
jgi:ribosomal protein S18 acetylase RimI-like enzyme